MITEDLEKQIYNWIFTPLDKMLNGDFPDAPMPYAINGVRMDSFFDSEFYNSQQNDNIEFTETIESTIKELREGEFASIVGKILMPLYRELLFHPAERMLKYHHVSGCDNKRKLLRRAVTEAIYDILLKEKYLSHLFDDISLIDAVELCIAAEERHYDQKRAFIFSLATAIEDGYSTNWDELYAKVRPEIKNAPKNYKKSKLEYCCMLMAVIMIMRNADLTIEKRNTLLNQLYDDYNWEVIAYLYSVLLGSIIHSGFSNPIQIVRLFGNSKKEYAHLLYPCVLCHPSVIKAPAGQPYKQFKYDEAFKVLEEACDSDQSDNLDDLFSVIFPNATLKDYSNDTLKLTTAEKQKRFEQQQDTIKNLTKQINDQQIEISELRLYREAAEKLTCNYSDNVISIDELKQAIDAIKDPEKALQFYFQLNHILRKNATWKKHAEEIGDFVDAKANSKDLEATENTNKIVDAVKKQKPSIIGQMNMGNGTQQLPPNFQNALENKEEQTK